MKKQLTYEDYPDLPWRCPEVSMRQVLEERAEEKVRRFAGRTNTRNYAGEQPIFYELRGQYGEWAFADTYDLPLQPMEDEGGGYDFTLGRRHVDVKACNMGVHHSGVWNPKPKWIYVWARVDDYNHRAALLGWLPGARLLERPPLERGNRTYPHGFPLTDLMPMETL